MALETSKNVEQSFRERIAALGRRAWWPARFDRLATAEASSIAKTSGADQALLFLRCALEVRVSEELGVAVCAISSDYNRPFEAVGLAEHVYFQNPSLRTDNFVTAVVRRLTPPPSSHDYRKGPAFFLNSLLRRERKLPHVWRQKARVHLDERKWLRATCCAEVAPMYDHLNVYTWLDAAALISQSKHPANPLEPGVVSGLANAVASACKGAITAAAGDVWVRKRASSILGEIGAYEYANMAAKGALRSTDDLSDLARDFCRLVAEDNLLE